MRIVCKMKDFYDYLVGKWGIDNKVVYNRNGILLKNEKKYLAFTGNEKYEACIGNYVTIDTKRGVMTYDSWKVRKDIKVPVYYSVLWFGDEVHLFGIELYRDQNGKVHSNWKELDTNAINEVYLKRKTEAPIELTFRSKNYIGYAEDYDIYEDPILAGTKYASLLDPEQTYLAIYSYLSRKNEKDVKDNRTNDEKIVCNGFDKKTSFRNIK